MRRLSSISWLAALAAIISVGAPLVHGQPHPPMGQGQGPVLAPAKIDAQVPAGSVVVQLVSNGQPVAGSEVSLSGSSNQKANTDAQGTSVFAGLVPGLYTASASAGGQAQVSERFVVTPAYGVRVVLGAPMPDRGGRPSSRQMSGHSRPEGKDPAGQLTIRTLQGELEQTEFGGLAGGVPEGATVHLVGLRSDGRVTLDSRPVTKAQEGRVVYDSLDRGGRVAYYALATFARPGGTDRLTSQSIQVLPGVGSRMMLAGRAPDAAAEPVDDLLEALGPGVEMPEPGVVRVRLFADESQVGLLEHVDKVALIAVHKQDEVFHAPTRPVQPAVSEVFGRSGPMRPRDGLAPGEVSFFVVRPSQDRPLSEVEVMLEPKTTEVPAPGAPPTPTALRALTDSEGMVVFRGLDPDTEYQAVATLFGSPVRSDAFKIDPSAGKSFAFAFEWPDQKLLEGEFRGVAHGADKVYLARIEADGRSFYSTPFQLTPERGALLGIFMYPEVLFSLHGGAELDDERLWFQTQFSLANPGNVPFEPGQEGLVIPLPKGFLGASVQEEMTARVKVESDKGFVWRGALPPGQVDFIATFALPVTDGKVTFDMALPYGVRKGRLVLQDHAGMDLRLPEGAVVRPLSMGDGKKYRELPDIDVAPRQRLVFALQNLPRHPAWQRVLRWGAGVVAAGLLLWVLWVVFRSGDKTVNDPARRDLERARDRLMNELVELEVGHRHNREDELSYQDKRTQLRGELVEIYRKLDELELAKT